VLPETETLDAVTEAMPRRIRALELTLASRCFKISLNADRWCCYWFGPMRGGSGGYECLCPADAIAERVSRVLVPHDELAGADE
jgi:hypothetical protein